MSQASDERGCESCAITVRQWAQPWTLDAETREQQQWPLINVSQLRSARLCPTCEKGKR